ncbi:MAG: hypothetical protein Tsb0015_14200 [Simkaniaceae bacterium]
MSMRANSLEKRIEDTYRQNFPSYFSLQQRIKQFNMESFSNLEDFQAEFSQLKASYCNFVYKTVQPLAALLNSISGRSPSLYRISGEVAQMKELGETLEKIKTLAEERFSSPSSPIASPLEERREVQEIVRREEIALREPIGIHNPANNCWIISFMQLLLNDRFLYEHILRALPNTEQFHPLVHFANAYARDQSAARQTTIANSQDLRLCFRRLSGNSSYIFSDSQYHNEDAAEAWHVLRKYIPEDEHNPLFTPLQVIRKYKEAEGVEGLENGCSRHQFLESQILLDMQEHQTFDAMMKAFFSRRASNEEHGIYGGQKYALEEEARIFQRPPQHLIIILNRFKWQTGSYHKNLAKIEIPKSYAFRPEWTNLDKFMKYDLQGFTSHLGNTLSLGHYVTCIKDVRNTWRLCNDRQIYTLSSANMESYLNHAYILHFSLQGEIMENEARELMREYPRNAPARSESNLMPCNIERLQAYSNLAELESKYKNIEALLLALQQGLEQKDLLGIFTKLPEELKNELFYIKWLSDDCPDRPDYGKMEILQDVKCLAAIKRPYLLADKENILDQYLRIVKYQQEYALAKIELMHLREIHKLLSEKKYREIKENPVHETYLRKVRPAEQKNYATKELHAIAEKQMIIPYVENRKKELYKLRDSLEINKLEGLHYLLQNNFSNAHALFCFEKLAESSQEGLLIDFQISVGSVDFSHLKENLHLLLDQDSESTHIKNMIQKLMQARTK